MNRFIIIGIGNPGKKYEKTRHNAGRLFIQWMNNRLLTTRPHPAKAGSFGGQADYRLPLEIIQTEGWMNESGEWIRRKFSIFNFQFSNLFIAHDDLDIPLGKFKIQFGKGPKTHKGLLSIYQALGTKKFWHIRIGVDNRGERGAGPPSLASGLLGTIRSRPEERLVGGLDVPADFCNAKIRVRPKESGESYTLKPFRREEREILEETFVKIESALIEQIAKLQITVHKSQTNSNIQTTNSKCGLFVI